MFKKYLHSFQEPQILQAFLADAVLFTLLYSVWNWFKNTLEAQTTQISGGKTMEQVQAILLSGTQSQILLSQLQYLFFFMIIGFTVFTVLSIGGFSLTSNYIWGLLLKKKTKYLRWNALTLVELFPLIIYFCIAGIIYLFLSSLTTIVWIQSILKLIFILIWLLIAFSFHLSFVKSYRVWESIGSGFKLIATHWKNYGIIFLFSLLTSILLLLLLSVINYFLTDWQYLSLAITFFTFILFLSWMRLYYVQSLEKL